ncbi:hypothetical protein ACFPM7_21160 [Actinokineospora guangxiensis]|uniref:Uncharacterized protein n=1 Tax=Actinokineospora guangxiensis TaxID=1490288 RepID=A0ABW0ES03_9PSEU
MSSGPPQYPHGPTPGQQPWTRYPAGPGYGMAPPPPPPPKKSGGLVWAVLGVVLVLVAAGVTTYFLAFHESDGDTGARGGSGGSGGSGQAECEGDYCIGEYPYANACGVFPPSSVAAHLGTVGTQGLRVQETYADPLPPIDGEQRPSWTYGLNSVCYISPADTERAQFRSVSVGLKQTSTDEVKKPTKGRPLPGFDGALIEDLEGRGTVTWARGNVEATFDVTWTNRKPAIPDGKLAAAAKAIDDALASPPGPPSDLGDLSRGGQKIVNDACEVYTGADFQAATKFTVSPFDIKRTYVVGGGPEETSCRRTTASRNTIPAAEGTTILDGSMAPVVRISALRDAAAAKSRLAEDRENIDLAETISGIGDGAVFGVRGNRFTLVFTSGPHSVVIDCGLSNGNADWTPADMRQRLEPLAKAIAERMA